MAKKRIPTEEYNEMYYCITQNSYRYCQKSGLPYWRAATRRYATLVEARKAALAKSNRIMAENTYRSKGTEENVTMRVYKGKEFLGFVTTARIFPVYKDMAGIWNAKGSRDDQPMRKDGTLGRR